MQILLVLTFASACILSLESGGRVIAQTVPAPLVQAEALSTRVAPPQLILQTGHRLPVGALAFLSNGGMLLTGAADSLVKIWDVGTGRVQRTVEQGSAVTALAVAPDSGTWAVGSLESLSVYEARTGALLWQWPGEVKAVTFTPDSQSAVAITGDGRVFIWDVRTGDLRQSFRSGSTGPFSSGGGNVLACAPDGTLAVASHAGVIALHDPQTGALRREIWLRPLPQEGISAASRVAALGFSPDGTTLAAAQANPYNKKMAGQVQLWNAATGTLRRMLPLFTAPVNTLAWSPDGKMLATGEGDPWHAGSVKLWDEATGKLRYTVASPPVQTLALAPDNQTLACVVDNQRLAADYDREGKIGSVLLLNAQTGQVRRLLPGQPRLQPPLLVSAGKTLICGSDDGILHFWNLQSGRLEHTAASLVAWSTAIAGAPDGRVWMAGLNAAKLQVWDARAGRLVRTLALASQGYSVVFAAGGARLMTTRMEHLTAGERGVLDVWETATGRKVRSLVGTGTVFNVWLSPDAKTVTTARDDNAVQTWDMATGRLLRTVIMRAPHGDNIGSWVTFSPDAKIWAGSGGKLKSDVVETKTLALAQQWTDPDNRDLPQEGFVQLCDVRTGRLLHTLSNHRDAITAMAFAPDGKTFATSSKGGDVRLWDVTSGRRQFALSIPGSVQGLSFSAEGRLLAVNSEDGAVRLHDARSGRLLVTLQLLAVASGARGRTTEWITFTPDSYYDASAGAARFINWRAGDDLFSAAQYQATFHRPDLLRQALRLAPSR